MGDALADALAAAKQRGVLVRVITDNEQVSVAGSDVSRLQSCGILVRTDVSKSNLMHHKFVVVDGKLLLDGSFNWTPAAVHGNNENVIISSQPFVIQEFQKEFGRL